MALVITNYLYIFMWGEGEGAVGCFGWPKSYPRYSAVFWLPAATLS